MTEIPPAAAAIAPCAPPVEDRTAQEGAQCAGDEFAAVLALALAADPPADATLAAQGWIPSEEQGKSAASRTAPGTDAASVELAALPVFQSLAVALATAPEEHADAAAPAASAHRPGPEQPQPPGALTSPQAAAISAAPIASLASGAPREAGEEVVPASARPDRIPDPASQPEPAAPTATAANPDAQRVQPLAETAHRSASAVAASVALPQPTAPLRSDASPAYAPLRPGATDFPEAFCARVQLEIASGRAAASIEVSPPELGPVELRIRVSDGTAHVACSAPHAAAREAIAQALPQLRDMLAAQGLALGQTSVGAELPAREHHAPGGGDGGAGGSRPRETAAAPQHGESPAPATVRRGLLDVFA
jgi:flagellar hook-length control protein FliK